MKAIIKGLLFAVALIFSQLQAGTIETKIIGGDDATQDEWPATVALLQVVQGGLSQFCGAALIADKWVLTAAHCVDGVDPTTIFATIGATDWLTQGTEIAVKAINVHPNYNAQTVDSDLALLELEEDASLLTTTIPLYDTFPDVGNLVTIVGWGTTVYDPITGESTVPSTWLQEVEVPVVDQAECNNIYPGQITDNMFCAGYVTNGGLDSCQGDSGGPVMAPQNGEFRLVGVVSWGNGCALPGFPGLNTKIDQFRSWISSTMTGITPPPAPSTGGGGGAFSWLFLPFGLLILLFRRSHF